MHRTQILIENWQYQVLRARAEQEGRSISDLVREILHNALSAPPDRKGKLREIEGIGEDRAESGRDHDRFLYDVENKR